jgi:putative SOS response-associated peptidase YedK
MSKAAGDLLGHFEAKEIEGRPPPPSWNVAPTRAVPIIAETLDEDSVERRLLIARWGLVPSCAKDLMIGVCAAHRRTRLSGRENFPGSSMDLVKHAEMHSEAENFSVDQPGASVRTNAHTMAARCGRASTAALFRGPGTGRLPPLC